MASSGSSARNSSLDIRSTAAHLEAKSDPTTAFVLLGELVLGLDHSLFRRAMEFPLTTPARTGDVTATAPIPPTRAGDGTPTFPTRTAPAPTSALALTLPPGLGGATGLSCIWRGDLAPTLARAPAPVPAPVPVVAAVARPTA
mmetsp:Transcript_8780/g.19751  ORF Transcript_8780/g.19751 Transcript_8780/m.19751 type:complete len:143 (-) Transcript_8780:155-583(-)